MSGYFANGSVGSSSPVGTSVTWSIAGRHYFRHDQIGFSYSGNFAQYSQNAGLSGANNSVAFDYGHYFSRRLSMNLGMSGSILSQNYALNNPDVGPETTVANVNLGTSPNIQITDNGVKQVSLQGNFVWQQTTRLSFDGGGSYFAVERDTPGLQGMTGSQAHTDVNYRLTRQMTVGSYYSLSDYVYPHGFGTSTINTFGGIFSYAFSRTWQIAPAGRSLQHRQSRFPGDSGRSGLCRAAGARRGNYRCHFANENERPVGSDRERFRAQENSQRCFCARSCPGKRDISDFDAGEHQRRLRLAAFPQVQFPDRR